MEIKNIEKKDNGRLAFQAVVDAETFEKAVNQAYLKARKNIMVPGFRKGKAPRMIIEGMYGANVFYEDAVESLALDAYTAGVEACNERLVGDPAITNFDVAEDKTLTIDFESDLYPEATLGQYKGLEAYKAPVKVMAEDVNKEIENVRKRNSRIVTVERKAKNGDTVNIDYDGYKDGVRFDGGKDEGHDLVLGSGSFVPGFEEQLVGVKAGDEKELNITFPENYHKDLAGAEVVFKVKVNAVKETELPALDDEFAKDVSEFDTLKDYKASVKKDLTERRKEAAERDFRNALLTKAVENMTVTVPDSMINERLNSFIDEYARNCAMQGMSLEQYFMMMGIDERGFRTYMRPTAENEIKTEILLEKIAEAEKIEVSAEEIENEYKTAADTYGMELEKVKETVAEEIVVRDIKMRKAADILAKNGVATDKPEGEEAEAAEKEEAPKEEKKTAKKTGAAKKTAAKKDTENNESAKDAE